jgi:hypothetical protein
MPWRRTGGVEVQLQAFLISALDGDEWSSSRPGHFIPRPGKSPSQHKVDISEQLGEQYNVWEH